MPGVRNKLVKFFKFSTETMELILIYIIEDQEIPQYQWQLRSSLDLWQGQPSFDYCGNLGAYGP